MKKIFASLLLTTLLVPSLVSAQLTVPQGGTGLSSVNQGRLLFGDSAFRLNHNPLLNWDNSSNSLGIGTSTPISSLHVDGDVSFLGENFATTTIGKNNIFLTIGEYFTAGSEVPSLSIPIISGRGLIASVIDFIAVAFEQGIAIIQTSPEDNPTIGFLSMDANDTGNLGFIEFATTTSSFIMKSDFWTGTSTIMIGDVDTGTPGCLQIVASDGSTVIGLGFLPDGNAIPCF